MLGSGGQVSRFFSPVATETRNRLAQIDEVSSLMTSDSSSGVHAIVFSKSGARNSATFLSPPPKGDIRRISFPSRTNAIWRPSGDQAGEPSAIGVLVSCTKA